MKRVLAVGTALSQRPVASTGTPVVTPSSMLPSRTTSCTRLRSFVTIAAMLQGQVPSGEELERGCEREAGKEADVPRSAAAACSCRDPPTAAGARARQRPLGPPSRAHVFEVPFSKSWAITRARPAGRERSLRR